MRVMKVSKKNLKSFLGKKYKKGMFKELKKEYEGKEILEHFILELLDTCKLMGKEERKTYNAVIHLHS